MPPSQFLQAAACVVLVALSCACRSAAPAVDQVLAPAVRPAPQAAYEAVLVEVQADPAAGLLERAQQLQEEFDDRTRQDRAALSANPQNASLLIAASRSLFLDAELRLRRAELAYLFAGAPKSLAQVLDAEAQVPSAVKLEVLALSREGLEFAKQALADEAQHVAALHYTAVHSAQIAWAKGAVAALLGGWGPRVAGAIKSAVAADDAFEDGEPLRLSGRFLTRAPWPYKNLAKAVVQLERAVLFAPMPVTWFFLGDARYAAGDQTAAIEAWQQASACDLGGARICSDHLHRELAQLRLAALAAK